MNYQEIVERRRRLSIVPYKSLADVGFDGPWVTPYQISSKSPDGPVLLALHWLEEATIADQRMVLEKFGYLPDIRFNTVIDMALERRPTFTSPRHFTSSLQADQKLLHLPQLSVFLMR